MLNFVIALIIVFGGLWLIKSFAKVKPAAMPTLLQKLGGGALIGLSGLIALRGNMNAAIPVFLAGLGLIGKTAAYPNGFNWGKSRETGQKSKVETPMLAMELDHDTGKMDGTVRQGPSAGRLLSAMTVSDLQAFHSLCGAAGDQSAALLESWLDRNHANWKDEWEQPRTRPDQSAGKMTIAEAYAILGLKPGANNDDIKQAHRRLMKQVHPDHGGSDYLAAKINAAKDLLQA